MINTPLQVIGRDPAITIQIIKMIAERQQKAQRRSEFFDKLKLIIKFWK